MGSFKCQRSAKENKARMERFEELNSREFQQRNETLKSTFHPGPRLGNKVVEVKVSVNHSMVRIVRKLVYCTADSDCLVLWDQMVRVKPLFRMMTGEQQPDTVL